LRENAALKAASGVGGGLPFIAKSPRMRGVVEAIEKLRDADCNILITGPTGTGKGLSARLIHNLGVRRENPFIGVNC
jgi:two-component system response regulator AtoC